MSKAEVRSHTTVTCVKVKGGLQPECMSSPTFTVNPNMDGVVAKIPVVLAELTVQVNLDSIISLPEPALEIKEIKKQVKVIQCLLLQPTNVLFIKGFIRKNIKYASLSCSTSEGVCGDVRHCTVDVPFKCTANVSFNGVQPIAPQINHSNEFQFFRKQSLNGPGFAEKDKLLSGDFSEYNKASQEQFNELPFCELINTRVIEYDELLNRARLSTLLPFEEKIFTQIEEKAILFITLKILQNLQVEIPPAFECEEEFDCEEPFQCQNEFDCEDPFECDNTFNCQQEFQCVNLFDCTEPFNCGTEFICSDPFSCDDPFSCLDSSFTCESFDCEQTFDCSSTFTCEQQFSNV